MFRDFLSLVYPHTCASCGKSLYNNEGIVCIYCRYRLRKTNYHLKKDNPVMKLFWGRIPAEAATAHYFFRKGGRVQRMIHQLKYSGRKEVGVFLGKLIGADLKRSPLYEGVECVVPVPLHPAKKRKRGYNQSELIASGVAESMNIELITENLVRESSGDTQTTRSRFSRWLNVESVFSVRKSEQFNDRHVLLIDDVVTTGATIEACVSAIRKSTNVKVSIAAIALAAKN